MSKFTACGDYLVWSAKVSPVNAIDDKAETAVCLFFFQPLALILVYQLIKIVEIKPIKQLTAIRVSRDDRDAKQIAVKIPSDAVIVFSL